MGRLYEPRGVCVCGLNDVCVPALVKVAERVFVQDDT